MRKTCGYRSKEQTTKGDSVLHQADDWKHVCHGRALRHQESRGAPSNHIGQRERVQCGEPDAASLAEMQEDLDDISLVHVITGNREKRCIRGNLVHRGGIAQPFQGQGGVRDVNDTRQETHGV